MNPIIEDADFVPGCFSKELQKAIEENTVEEYFEKRHSDEPSFDLYIYRLIKQNKIAEYLSNKKSNTIKFSMDGIYCNGDGKNMVAFDIDRIYENNTSKIVYYVYSGYSGGKRDVRHSTFEEAINDYFERIEQLKEWIIRKTKEKHNKSDFYKEVHNVFASEVSITGDEYKPILYKRYLKLNDGEKEKLNNFLNDYIGVDMEYIISKAKINIK